MYYLASAVTYYEGETILGVFTTKRRAINAALRDKKGPEFSDEWVVYEMPLNEDSCNWSNQVWSNKETT